MRKKYLLIAVLMLACFVFTGIAAAGTVYMKTSDIPMARDFSVEVAYDAQGYPKIITDYPYEETGARELNLVFNKGDFYEAATVRYSFLTGETRITGYNSYIYKDGDFDGVIAADIRSGALTMDDKVFINTNRNSAETDWVLGYSVSRKEYISYEEKTYSQAFNAMDAGGYATFLDYEDGELSAVAMQKRIDRADLFLNFSRQTGELMSASVYTYDGDYYKYDRSTGLFDGKTLTELGFEESDINLTPFTQTGVQTLVTSTEVAIPAVTVRGNPAATIVGGLLSGILIGLTLFRMFRRRKEEPKPFPAEEAPGTDETFEAPARHLGD